MIDSGGQVDMSLATEMASRLEWATLHSIQQQPVVKPGRSPGWKRSVPSIPKSLAPAKRQRTRLNGGESQKERMTEA